MEEKLEAIPAVKPEAHFELNDAAGKVLKGEKLDEHEEDAMDAIYRELQDLEKMMVNILNAARSEESISKEEFLLAVNHFLIAQQQGPDSSMLKDLFESGEKDLAAFLREIETISIPKHTKQLLIQVYQKI